MVDPSLRSSLKQPATHPFASAFCSTHAIELRTWTAPWQAHNVKAGSRHPKREGDVVHKPVNNRLTYKQYWILIVDVSSGSKSVNATILQPSARRLLPFCHNYPVRECLVYRVQDREGDSYDVVSDVLYWNSESNRISTRWAHYCPGRQASFSADRHYLPSHAVGL